MNFTFHKMSSQIDLKITGFYDIKCTQNECSTDQMDKNQLFKIDFQV